HAAIGNGECPDGARRSGRTAADPSSSAQNLRGYELLRYAATSSGATAGAFTSTCPRQRQEPHGPYATTAPVSASHSLGRFPVPWHTSHTASTAFARCSGMADPYHFQAIASSLSAAHPAQFHCYAVRQRDLRARRIFNGRQELEPLAQKFFERSAHRLFDGQLPHALRFAVRHQKRM